MRKLIAVVCFMLAASPLAFAQDKGKDDAKKAVPAAEVKADKGKDAGKKPEKSKGDEKKAVKAKKEPSPAQKAQQERMRVCNEQAADKKGDDRKKFMSACLKEQRKAEEGKRKAQQEKMKSCNKEAGDKKLKGDDRKKFMSECLSAR